MEQTITITRINEEFLKKAGYNRPAEETTEDGAYITRNWDNDGALEIHNAKTLDAYNKLSQAHPDIARYGVFFAFDNRQFKDGYARLVKDGYIKDGERICRTAYGLYGVRSELDRYFDFYEQRDKAIAEECDPQEVYWSEWNNHECMYDYDGDRPAMEHIIRIFGKDRAIRIRRTNGYMDIDEIIAKER